MLEEQIVDIQDIRLSPRGKKAIADRHQDTRSNQHLNIECVTYGLWYKVTLEKSFPNKLNNEVDLK